MSTYKDSISAADARTGVPRINYWIFNYEPQWEAASKEVHELAQAFRLVYGARTISLNVHSKALTLSGPDKRFPAAIGLPSLPLLLRMARATDINHVFASAAERILTPRLARLDRTILTVTKGTPALAGIEKNVAVLKGLQHVVVESERYRDLLWQLGLDRERVHLIYPGLPAEEYKPASGPFTILFATSPRKYALLGRGVHLMVRAAERLPDVRFRFIWRRDVEEAEKLVRAAGVDNVEIVSGQIDDMKAMYDAAHTVILPALESESLKPCPHSGLHALAHGKPVLVSQAASFSAIVEREACGIVFEPTIESLCEAIGRLRSEYDRCQRNAHATLNRHFSNDGFIDRYRALYERALAT